VAASQRVVKAAEVVVAEAVVVAAMAVFLTEESLWLFLL